MPQVARACVFKQRLADHPAREAPARASVSTPATRDPPWDARPSITPRSALPWTALRHPIRCGPSILALNNASQHSSLGRCSCYPKTTPQRLVQQHPASYLLHTVASTGAELPQFGELAGDRTRERVGGSVGRERRDLLQRTIRKRCLVAHRQCGGDCDRGHACEEAASRHDFINSMLVMTGSVPSWPNVTSTLSPGLNASSATPGATRSVC